MSIDVCSNTVLDVQISILDMYVVIVTYVLHVRC